MTSPAFQFYVRDWLVSTRMLSPEARGVYIDLLAYAWDNDGIPDDPKALAGLAAITPRRFKSIWPELECKWISAEGGVLRNPRQEKQRAQLMALREKRAAAGRASAAARNGTGDEH